MQIKQALTVVLIFGLFLISLLSRAQLSHAQQDLNSEQSPRSHQIPFYLPIQKDQFPGLVQQLESALLEAGLEELKLTTSDYWHPYQQGIRQGRRGIFFAAPHFASWLVNTHKFDPALRLSGKSQYVIVARRADSEIFEVRDLANKTVCTDATMDLSFLLVRESMTRSLLSAKTLRVQNVAETMKRNRLDCDAFSLSEHLLQPFLLEDPFQFIRLQQSDEYSNYAYLLNPEVPATTKRALRKFLVSKKAKNILQPMYRLFSEEPTIVSAKSSNYPPSQMQSLQPYWGSR